jgi:hypothetical protein
MRRMSQMPQEPVFVHAHAATQPTNSLGLAGFITSVVGILFGGLLCPVGLILSLVALGRPPRGFAVAGVVIGLLGSCSGCLVAMLLLPAFVVAAVGGVTLMGAMTFALAGGTPAIETFDHMMQISRAVEKYERQNGQPPAALGDLSLPAAILNDGWGTPLEYTLKQGSASWDWTLRTAGPNRTFDPDDLSFEGSMSRKP